MIKSVQVSLNTIEKVKGFVKDISMFENEFEIISGKSIINAKSILSIFSLNLVKPMRLNIHGSENIEKIIEVLDYYIV